jgi:hypothetical protein
MDYMNWTVNTMNVFHINHSWRTPQVF